MSFEDIKPTVWELTCNLIVAGLAITGLIDCCDKLFPDTDVVKVPKAIVKKTDDTVSIQFTGKDKDLLKRFNDLRGNKPKVEISKNSLTVLWEKKDDSKKLSQQSDNKLGGLK